jgi:hypothetical protein
MAITTLFELATQHGEIAAHMSKYLKRQKHTFDIIREQNGLGDRVYRVFKGDRPDPIFQYRIPERTSTETAGMWAYKVKRELDREWKTQTTRASLEKKVEDAAALHLLKGSPTPTSPALGLLELTIPDSGVGGTPPDSPSISSSPTSLSTGTTPASESSSSAAAVAAPGVSETSPPPTSSKTSSKSTIKRLRTQSGPTGS